MNSNGISENVFPISRNDNHPSPATDSPATPTDTTVAPDVKIDMDYADNEQESDVRHEPLPIKELDATITIHPDAAPHDVLMNDTTTPAATPGISADFSMASIDANVNVNGNVNGSNGSATRSLPEDSDDNGPPTKRARMHSDADMASMTHSATPPPASHAPTPPPPPPTSSALPPPTTTASTMSFASQQENHANKESSLNVSQFRFLQSTLRTLRKLKESAPFIHPVDPIALNIPHYFSIIKNPMDISTIERKLGSSSPVKPDPNPHNPRYHHAEEFIADIRLMVGNAVLFNGPDHIVATMGKRLEDVFDKTIKHLPPKTEKPKAPVVRKVATPPAPPPPVSAPPPKKAQPQPRRPSTSVPVIRRSDAEAIGRPKREIHPPPPKDLPYADAPKKNRKGKRTKPDGSSEQLKYCSKILQDLNKKQYYNFAYPFYEPVDWQKLDIPSYPKLIKKPMDLSTMRKKLDNGDYDTAQNFYDDFKLMIRNCFTFNPAGTPVAVAGQELQRLFDEKWKGLPALIHPESEDEDEEEDDSEDERRRTIAMMESQIETMRNNIESLKTAKAPKEKKKKVEKKEKAPVASTSKPPPKQPKAAPSKKKAKKNITDDDVLTFEQKKDLSESIGKLDGARLERVIQIIHEGVPEIRDSTEEIELEIDQLPAAVLTKLYNYVLRPIRQPAQPKRNRTGKGTGTGGLKRKSMDEEKEAEKIRQLEERMALFEGRGTVSTAPVRRDQDSDHSSDSSSGSDTSGSDSD